MVAPTLRWTTRDLTAMPDDGGWKRYEIIDGELYVTRAPHICHQNVSGNLQFELESWSRQTKLGKPVSTPGVIFSPYEAVIPDLVWVSNTRLENGLDESGHFIVAPELVIEVLSAGPQNIQRDTEIKLKLYSRYGVQEYWIVNWRLKTIEVYRRVAAQLERAATLGVGDLLTSPLLPEFAVAIAPLFEG
ncbi:Uma2 family endonuclease [Spirulina major]|uniref:Uma2 family endonuclease n=1 Tax=Spirulina major TaxID=270636 RepID=UPI00093414DD|nr:Uma2 family endonuclease [Spirulina major]